MAGLLAGNTDTSCAFFENEIILGDPSSPRTLVLGVVKVMFKQKWEPLERMYAVVSPADIACC